MIDSVKIQTDERTKALLESITSGLEDSINVSLDEYRFKDNMNTLSESLEKINELSELKSKAETKYSEFEKNLADEFKQLKQELESLNEKLDEVTTQLAKPWYKKIFV